MKTNLPRIVDAFAGLNIVVIGEAMLDRYLQGTTCRLCPEAPVPVVELSAKIDQPGGAANAAFNARCLGASVSFLSVVGDDADGASLLHSLEIRDVDPLPILIQRGRRTLSKHRVFAGSQLLVRFDQGDTDPMAAEIEARLVERLGDVWRRCDAAIVSDYGYGILTPGVIARLAELQSEDPRVLVVDSKRLSLYHGVRPTAIKPNYNEALRILGVPRPPASSDRADWMTEQGPHLLESAGARIVSVTLDTEGALIFERDRPAYRTFAKSEEPAKAAGAGDTFAVTLALALASGAETPAAADLASAASAVVVAKDGTASCTSAELRERVAMAGKSLSRSVDLFECVMSHRRNGRRIVFTNGCFDILHRGHVSYLSRAKALGDVLIVGVNSDASISRLKGPTRPINTLEDRIQVLAALSCVDHVVSFDEDTPHALINVIRPNVFVKGGDYTRATLPEASLVEQFGGLVEILPFLADRSTTEIITKICQSHGLPSDSPLVLGPATGRLADHAPLASGGNRV